MILAHLIGAQTLPNLLAVLALRPTQVIHVTSDAKRFAAPIRNLEKALALAGLKPAFQTLALPSVNPTPAEVANALTNLPPELKPTILNLTGGTKLMGLGAHTWAELNYVPSLYVDTAARTFTQTSTPSLPSLQTLPQVAATLSLEIVLTAHGVPANKLQGKAPVAAELAFGREAATAWAQDQACSAWKNTLRTAWFLPNGYPLPEAWRTAVPIPANAAAQLAQAAVTLGWATIDHLGRFTPAPPLLSAGDQQKRNAFVSDLLQNLEGGWFELYVAGLLLATPHFHDLRWSVEATTDREDLALGENDLVALDRRTLSPVFISCKSSTSFPKPLEHVFSLRQRASHFGGTFAQAVLCISRTHNAEDAKRILGFCKAASVTPLFGDEAIAAWLNR